MEQLGDLVPFAGQNITFGGIVTNLREGVSKRNKAYGIAKLEDYSGQGEVALFGDDWTKYRNLFVEGNALFITASVQPRRWDPSQLEMKLDKVEFLADINDTAIKKITISAKMSDLSENLCANLVECLTKNKGTAQLYFKFYDEITKSNIMMKSRQHSIDVSIEVLDELDGIPEIQYQIN